MDAVVAAAPSPVGRRLAVREAVIAAVAVLCVTLFTRRDAAHLLGVSPDLLALLVLMAVIGKTFAEVGWRTVTLVAGLTLAGALARLWLSEPTLLGMSNYEREPILLKLREIAPYLRDAMPAGIDRFAEIHALNLALSWVIVPLTFVHCQLAFGSRFISSWTAAFIAFGTIPIFYAQSDTLFISSMALSSSALILLHEALLPRHVLWRIVCGASALWLFELVVGARQINFLFSGVALLAVAHVVLDDWRSRWGGVAWAGAMLYIGLATFADMATWMFPGADVGDIAAGILSAGSSHSLLETFAIQNNYFVRPDLYPLPLTILALGGAAVMWRPHRRALVYAGGWVAIFYVGHCVLPAWDARAMCRYALHTVLPAAMLAAFGLRWAWRRWPPQVAPRAWLGAAVVSAGLWIAATGLYRLPTSDVRAEYEFLRDLQARGVPEDGALVIEPYTDVQPGEGLIGRSRYAYFGAVVSGRALRTTIDHAQQLTAGADRPTYLLIGLPCFWRTLRVGQLMPACAEALASHEWQLVEQRSMPSVRHDISNGRALAGEAVALYRLARPHPTP